LKFRNQSTTPNNIKGLVAKLRNCGAMPRNFSLNADQEFELLQSLPMSEQENAYERVMGKGQYQANVRI
jgi:hypothetical protein